MVDNCEYIWVSLKSQRSKYQIK